MPTPLERMVHTIKRLDITADERAQLLRDAERVQMELDMDALTKLFNERGLIATVGRMTEHQLKVEANRRNHVNEEHRLAVIFMDLDKFKPLNDVFGHKTGDVVLKRLAQIIRRRVRGTDIVAARPHGDEFILALPNAGTKDATFVAEHIKRLFDSVEWGFNEGLLPEQQIQPSLTFGVAATDEHKNCSFEHIIMIADDKMNEAKGDRSR